jgi:translation initiation factor 5B
VPTLLMVLVGLIQQFLEKKIQYTDGPAKGVVLEVKKETGYGITLDTIIFDGHLKKGQTVVIGGLDGPITTHIRALLTPKDLDEIRDPTKKFTQNDIVYAASGVKILAPNIENVIAGAPIRAVGENEEIADVEDEIRKELDSITIDTDEDGFILKADTLGSLEAAAGLFRQSQFPIRKAGVGAITKKDVTDAVAAREVDEYSGTICGFNVKVLKDAQAEASSRNIRIFTSDVVYRLVDDYKDYMEMRKSEENSQAMDDLILPGRVEILPQYIFRNSNPMIVGVRVDGGKIVPKQKLINEEGKVVGTLHSITSKNKPVGSASNDEEVAISISGATLGRNVKDTDVLYIRSPESDIRALRTRFRDELSPDTLKVLIEYVKIMRKKDTPYWAA